MRAILLSVAAAAIISTTAQAEDGEFSYLDMAAMMIASNQMCDTNFSNKSIGEAAIMYAASESLPDFEAVSSLVAARAIVIKDKIRKNGNVESFCQETKKIEYRLRN